MFPYFPHPFFSPGTEAASPMRRGLGIPFRVSSDGKEGRRERSLVRGRPPLMPGRRGGLIPVGSHGWGLSGRVVNEMCLPLGRWKQMSIFVGWEDGDGLRFRIHRDSQVQILQKLKRNESASVYIVVKNVRTMLFWKKMHRVTVKKQMTC